VPPLTSGTGAPWSDDAGGTVGAEGASAGAPGASGFEESAGTGRGSSALSVSYILPINARVFSKLAASSPANAIDKLNENITTMTRMAERTRFFFISETLLEVKKRFSLINNYRYSIRLFRLPMLFKLRTCTYILIKIEKGSRKSEKIKNNFGQCFKHQLKRAF